MTANRKRTDDQLDLLDYPRAPGFQKTDTSVAAAVEMALELGRLQQLVLAAVQLAGSAGLTADEAAINLGLTQFTCRPRLTELATLGLIEDSKKRRTNLSGRKAIVWIAVAPESLVVTTAEAERQSRRRRKADPAEARVRRIMREEPVSDAEKDRKQRMNETLAVVVQAKSAMEETGTHQGEMPCPRCGGTIRFAEAPSNGHSRGSCTTKGCIAWIE